MVGSASGSSLQFFPRGRVSDNWIVGLNGLLLTLIGPSLLALGCDAADEIHEGGEDLHPWHAELCNQESYLPADRYYTFLTVNFTNHGSGDLTVHIDKVLLGPYFIALMGADQNNNMVIGQAVVEPGHPLGGWNNPYRLSFFIVANSSSIHQAEGYVNLPIIDWEGKEPLNKSITLEFTIIPESEKTYQPYLDDDLRYENELLYTNFSGRRSIGINLQHLSFNQVNLTVNWSAWYPDGFDFVESSYRRRYSSGEYRTLPLNTSQENRRLHGLLTLAPGESCYVLINFTYDGTAVDSALNLTIEAVNWTGAPLPALPFQRSWEIVSLEPHMAFDVYWPFANHTIEHPDNRRWPYNSDENSFYLNNSGNLELTTQVIITSTNVGLRPSYDQLYRTYNITNYPGQNRSYTLQFYHDWELAPGDYQVNVTFLTTSAGPILANTTLRSEDRLTITMPAYAMLDIVNYQYFDDLLPGEEGRTRCSITNKGNVADNVSIEIVNIDELRKKGLEVQLIPGQLTIEPGNTSSFIISIYTSDLFLSGAYDIELRAVSTVDPDVTDTYIATAYYHDTEEMWLTWLAAPLVIMFVVAVLIFAAKKKNREP